MDIEIAIIGGGLSGLAVADSLGGRDWHLFEARDRFGGRVLNHVDAQTGSAFDMGPAWIWPHNQRLRDAARRFDLRIFGQHAEGRLVFQDQTGGVRRDLDFSTMAGALRVEGGLGRLIEGYSSALPTERLHQNHRLVRVERLNQEMLLTFDTDQGAVQMRAEHVVFALPPRLLADTVDFQPALPQATLRAMQQVPTWMAGHAKVMAIYETPFWRTAGLSGDAVSHRGPMVEIHDASPLDGKTGALFGFVGVPATHRENAKDALIESAQAQLTSLFGPEAATPVTLTVQDWAFEPFTATRADFNGPNQHPAYGMPPELINTWDGLICFAGTEVAATEGGFLEGALEAADHCAHHIVSRRATAA